MNNTARKLPRRSKQQGALIILTLLILIVVSMLGMSAIDSTGLEMKMSSNSRLQQEAFEAAEYTLSWVENNIKESGYFSAVSINNQTGCGSVCFSASCTNGYCFQGNVGDWGTCHTGTQTTEFYEDATVWSTAAKHKTLDIENTDITASYIIEFWCYTARQPDAPIDAGNFTHMYRITAYAVGEGGKARAMLRSVIKQI